MSERIFGDIDMDAVFRDSPGLARAAYPEEAKRRGLTPITEESIRAYGVDCMRRAAAQDDVE